MSPSLSPWSSPVVLLPQNDVQRSSALTIAVSMLCQFVTRFFYPEWLILSTGRDAILKHRCWPRLLADPVAKSRRAEDGVHDAQRNVGKCAHTGWLEEHQRGLPEEHRLFWSGVKWRSCLCYLDDIIVS